MFLLLMNRYLEMKFVGHIVILIQETAEVVLKVLSFYIASSNITGSYCLHIFIDTFYCSLSDASHPSR